MADRLDSAYLQLRLSTWWRQKHSKNKICMKLNGLLSGLPMAVLCANCKTSIKCIWFERRWTNVYLRMCTLARIPLVTVMMTAGLLRAWLSLSPMSHHPLVSSCFPQTRTGSCLTYRWRHRPSPTERSAAATPVRSRAPCARRLEAWSRSVAPLT